MFYIVHSQQTISCEIVLGYKQQKLGRAEGGPMETTELIKASLLSEGKTKRIFNTADADAVIIENKSDITANDDPNMTKQFSSKAVSATTTTCRVFEILQTAGIPVSYRKQLSPTEFLADRCKMLFLEVIMRRYGVGSFTKRRPDLIASIIENPHRFHRLVFELFLKTTGGIVRNSDGDDIRMMPDDPLLLPDKEKPLDDPLICNPYEQVLHLFHPKTPSWTPEADLEISLDAKSILPEGVTVEGLEDITRRTFLVLESAWAQLGFRLIDFKIEFGINTDGQLVVADVIDNDSWRLRTPDWQEISKQCFRDGDPLGEIEEKYQLVADLVQRFHMPHQAIVIWRGSESDSMPDVPEIAGVSIEDIAMSGHKATQGCLDQLSQYEAKYPEGGVIIVIVGLSNGLGPIIAAHTNWPVLAVSVTADDYPADVMSSLRMPSNVPLTTCLKSQNAILAGLNILSQKNPAVYTHQRLAMEELDR